MLEANGGLSLEIFANELPEIPRERGLLVLNTTLFDIFAMELPEGPEGKHWLALDSPPLEFPEEINLLTSCTGTGTVPLSRLTL